MPRSCVELRVELRGLPSDYVRGNTPIVGVGTLLGRGVGTPP